MAAITFNWWDDMLKGSWDDTLFMWIILVAFHCVSLSGACLPIGKNCPIIALKHTLDNGESWQFEDIDLLASRRKSHIKAEYSFLFSCFLRVGNKDLPSLLVDMDNGLKISLVFFGGHRPTSDSHLDTLVFVAHLNFEIYNCPSNHLRSYNR